MRVPLLLAFMVSALSTTPAASQSLPPITPELTGASAVVCVKIDDAGAVSGAFIVTTTGDAAKDRALVAWVRQLHWDPVTPGESGRNSWFPMPVAIGGTPPAAPPSCAPPADKTQA